MAFQNPFALLLLFLLIPIARIGWPGRGYGRSREITALALRCAVVILLVLAAAGLELRQGNDDLAVVFLVDASDSISVEDEGLIRAFIEQSLQAMAADDRAAVIVFGGDALVERPLSSDRELARFTSIPNTTQTDLAEAVRLGMALYPPDAARRMVLLSDGRQTTGDVLGAARLATQAGVDFLVAALEAGVSAQEITLLGVDLPGRLIEGEAFDLSFTVHAHAPAAALVRILAGGSIVFEGLAELDGGVQSFRIPLVAGETGFTHYIVQLSATDDGFHQNNRLSAFTTVIGPPKVLMVVPPPGEPLPLTGGPRPDESAQLAAALEAAGFTVDLVRPSGLPFELALLSEYASLVLVDVPARDLSDRQMEAVQSYVRDLGGGLLVVGGPTSYGVGGYFRTPLEETLPVEMEIKDQERRPGLTMIFIIDRSGSMDETNQGVTKLDLAKEATIRSLELLFPGDKVGVIAFDDVASWVVPITDLSDQDAAIAAVETIGLGGGTDIMAGLRAMADVLPQDDSAVKHVILLTDGGASAIGIPELVEELYTQHGITLTTVGVGSDSAPFLADIALIGGGRYHFTDRPETIPSIFTEETSLATRSYIVEESFFPALAGSSTILSQITEVPPLHGYVAATSKDTAQTVLVSPLGDPILATWQYGLGKAVAWTSDATARWARDWVTWEGFPTFWAQAVRFTVSDRSTSPLQIEISTSGEQAQVTIDAVGPDGGFLNNYAITANVIAPDGSVERLLIPQTAPGQYAAAFEPQLEGAYLLRFDARDPETGEAIADLAGWVLSYSPEYRNIRPETGLLTELADAAGGTIVALEAAASVFDRPAVRAASGLPLWQHLLAAALALLPLDIAVRRLAIERRDLVRAWARLAGRFVLQPAAAGAAPARPSRVSSLLQAKERREEHRQTGGDEPKPAPRPSGTARIMVEPPPAVEAKPAPPAEAPQDAVDEEDGATSTTSALLARKRARENRQKRN